MPVSRSARPPESSPDAAHAAGDVHASELQRRERLLQPVALLPTQSVLDRDVAVAEEHLRRLGSLIAELVEVFADREARRPLLDHQHGHAAMAWLRVWVGLDQYWQRVRFARVGDPRLGAGHGVLT